MGTYFIKSALEQKILSGHLTIDGNIILFNLKRGKTSTISCLVIESKRQISLEVNYILILEYNSV